MNQHSALSAEVTLTLSPRQAERLSQLLEDRSTDLADDAQAAALADMEERLADAHVIAQWLGENVRMDMPRVEAEQAHRILCEWRRVLQADDPLLAVIDQLGP